MGLKSYMKLCAIPVLALASVTAARADVTFTETGGACVIADCENVLAKGDAVGSPVYGITNQTQLDVEFTSTSNSLTLADANGQAVISPVGENDFTQFSFSVPGYYFAEAQLRFELPSGTDKDEAATDITVSINWVNLTAGTSGTSTFQSDGDFEFPAGDDRYAARIVPDSGQLIESVSISVLGEGRFDSIKQVRLGGIVDEEGNTPPEVPEPGTYALMGGGLLVLALNRRFRRSR